MYGPSCNIEIGCRPCFAAPAGDVGPAKIHKVWPQDSAGDLAHLGEEDGGAEAEDEQEEGPRGHKHPPLNSIGTSV